MAPVSTGEIFGVDRDGGQQAYLYGYRAYSSAKFRTKDTRLPQAEIRLRSLAISWTSWTTTIATS